MFENLIGSQLVEINDYGFTVKTPDDNYRHFEFETDQGGCCGYAEINTTLFYDLVDTVNNPIITNVQNESTDSYYAECKVTFFGGEKLLAQIEAEAGSGSGWCYGAYATCKCIETKEEENLASW